MKSVFTVALISLLCCSGGATHAATRPKPAVAGSLAGQVASNYSPVAEATVRVWRDGKEAATAHVDAKGEFRLPLKDGTYEIQASAPRFQPAIAARITVVVHTGQETWVNIEMTPAPK